MRRIHRFYWFSLLGLSGLWLLINAPSLSTLQGFFPWRNLLIQYSGVLGMGVMSLAMLLAVRPVRLEPWLGGLDKMYRLHKWLGIAGLVLSVGHWLLSEAPKWLVRAGLLERPQRGPGPQLDGLEAWLHGLRKPAEGLGEWAFYAAVLLMVLALVRRFPYQRFFQTHRLIAVAYLVLVFHAVVLMRFDYWGTPLGWLMGALMAGGSVAAVWVLLRRVGTQRQVAGEVQSVVRHDRLQVVEVTIALKGRWAGHDAGQFAFVTLHADEGPHPYTITSAWQDDCQITFIIKALGDYTATLAERVQVGDVVRIEGPYGRFNFEGRQRRQIWVGAGIGITPFIARMKALAQQADGREIDLFHTTAVYDPHAIGLLERDAREAGVGLHVLWDERDGLLNAQRIAQAVPQWRDADVWFCGPAGFGQALEQGLQALGLPAERLHRELFQMR